MCKFEISNLNNFYYIVRDYNNLSYLKYQPYSHHCSCSHEKTNFTTNNQQTACYFLLTSRLYTPSIPI